MKKNWKSYVIIAVCACLAFFEGLSLGRGDGGFLGDSVRYLLNLEFYIYLFLELGLGLTLLTAYLWFSSRKAAISYQEAEEADDEEGMDEHFKQAHCKLEYGTIAYNISSACFLFSLGGSVYLALVKKEQVMLLLVSALLYLGLFSLLSYYRKTLKLVRDYDLPSPYLEKDALDLLNSYDESEREANYESAFMTLFSLNQIVLPILYLILFILSFYLGEVQILAFLVLVFLHIYINVRDLKMVKNYFK